MITYEQWNKAIISYFFEDHDDPDRVVFLQTDAETLLGIAEKSKFKIANADEAADSLTEAVQNKVVYNGLVDLWKINPTKTLLRGDCPEDEPPQVAFLALTVLAANRMDKSEEASHTNYYVQLHRLLHGKPNHGIPKGIKYNEWEDLWKHLQKWARNQFNVELYLTEGSPKKKYVWYPISQCLINKYDEYRLQVIFQETDLKPGAYLAESQLLNILRSCRSFPKLSVKIKRPILQKNTAEIRLILGQIQLLLENWDGEVQEKIPSGITKKRRSTSIDVQLKFNTFISENLEEIRYWFRCKRNSQITFKSNSLNVETLQAHNEEWFESFVVDADRLSLQVLQNGIEIKSEETKPLTYRLKPDEVWVFRRDPERDNGWLSQSNLLLHEDHLIVFRKELNFRITSILKEVCDPFTSAKPICAGGEETDWQYVEVKPTVLVSTPIFRYRITTSDKISFVGGLPLDRRKNLYFHFCLPTIVVPNLIADSNDSFYMNDRAMDVPSDRKIEFSDKLSPGDYHLSYLDCKSTLRVICPKRSLEYQEKTFTTVLSKDQETIATYSVESTTEIMEKPGLWLAGTKFFGMDIPKVTWEDVKTKPPVEKQDANQSFKSPAQLISAIVKLAIELKFDKTSVPEWFNETIKYVDQNAAMRTLVQKKLQQYHKTALSYADLRKRGSE